MGSVFGSLMRTPQQKSPPDTCDAEDADGSKPPPDTCEDADGSKPSPDTCEDADGSKPPPDNCEDADGSKSSPAIECDNYYHKDRSPYLGTGHLYVVNVPADLQEICADSESHKVLKVIIGASFVLYTPEDNTLILMLPKKCVGDFEDMIILALDCLGEMQHLKQERMKASHTCKRQAKRRELKLVRVESVDECATTKNQDDDIVDVKKNGRGDDDDNNDNRFSPSKAKMETSVRSYSSTMLLKLITVGSKLIGGISVSHFLLYAVAAIIVLAITTYYLLKHNFYKIESLSQDGIGIDDENVTEWHDCKRGAVDVWHEKSDTAQQVQSLPQCAQLTIPESSTSDNYILNQEDLDDGQSSCDDQDNNNISETENTCIFEDWWYSTDDSAETVNEEWYTVPETDWNSEEDSPLYTGAPISMIASLLLILNFTFRHGITGECLSDLLMLISLHCITPNRCLTSVYKFMKYFQHLKNPLAIHKFCSTCAYPLSSNETECQVCASDLSKCSYFIEIPLSVQIARLFSRPGFFEQLQHRFVKKKLSNHNIEDIYDGMLYKQHCGPNGLLNKSTNISLMWYTDGVPLFKSSKFNIWPICFSINELPYAKRTRTENLLLGGLWFGEGKPSMLTFWEPFAKCFQELKMEGVEVTCPSTPSPFIVKVILLCGTCDLPAKCQVLNMIQFNGKYGCPQCLQPGQSVKTGKGSVWTFPFDINTIDKLRRTHTDTLDHAKQAHEGNCRVYGINGPSWLSCIQPDIINGTAVDSMHAVFLGVVRRFLNLWFSTSFSKESFSMSKLVNKVDVRLLAVKPPNTITRVPRSIAQHMKFWKASECRSWLYYYSLPVLTGIMKDEFLEHYMLLVESAYLLNLQSISLEQIDHCERLLVQFVCIFSVLYGDRNMTANVHQLLHMANVVRNLGPMWVYSCFPLEDFNGRLLKLFHGTQHPELQIVNAVGILAKLPELNYNFLKDPHIGKFLAKVSNQKRQSHPLRLMGLITVSSLSSDQLQVFKQAFPNPPNNYTIYTRLHKDGLNLTSVICKSVEKRNSYTVECDVDQKILLGQIYFYVKLFTCNCAHHSSSHRECPSKNLAILMELERLDSVFPVNSYGSTCNHLLHMQPSGNFIVHPISGIKQICVCVEVEKQLFVGKCPNIYDFD